MCDPDKFGVNFVEVHQVDGASGNGSQHDGNLSSSMRRTRRDRGERCTLQWDALGYAGDGIRIFGR